MLTATEQLHWAPLVRILRHSPHTDSKNRTVPVTWTRVIRRASFVQLQNCLVTMEFIFYGASANTPIWVFSLLLQHFNPIILSMIISWPLFSLEKLCGFMLNPPLTSVQTSNACLSYARMASVPSWCVRPLFSVVSMQNDICIMR